MNEPQNDGGNVFPKAITLGDKSISEGGLLIRDYFAAHASEQDIEDLIAEAAGTWPMPTRQCARYMHADKMIQARAAK
jgi:hypothetical protein